MCFQGKDSIFNIWINNLNFYHFLQFTVGKPELITIWLFSKQLSHELTIVFLWFSILRFNFKAWYTCAYRVSILSCKFFFLVPYVSISRIRENLLKYFRECILRDHILNFLNLHNWITVGAGRVNPICLWFTDSQPLAKYIASLDPRYSSLFMDNVWKEAFEHSDTTVGESVASFFCLLIMKSGYFVMIVYYSATGASDQRVRPAIRRFVSDH